LPLIGQSLRRLEDDRFLTGKAVYVEDVNLAGQAWGYFVRSPHAHATVDAIDTTEASAHPGVIGIYTYDDITDLGHLPCATSVASDDPLRVPPRPALATGRVRHVGDAVAFVVAETLIAARDAAEAVQIAYTELPCVIDAASALAAGAPPIWDFGNESYRPGRGESRLRRRRPYRRHRTDQQPPGHRANGNARRHRLI
jgi:carbon-monoxide dehydrogenase large subunit